jgi:maleylacetate reductase
MNEGSPRPAGVHVWPLQRRVHHGGSAADALATELQDARWAMLASTAGLRGSRIRAAVEQAIGSRLAGVCDDIRAHSPVEDVTRLAAALRDTGADIVVALGGGSVIDAAKAACHMVWHGQRDGGALLGSVRSDDGPRWKDGAPPRPRVVAVPTTLSAAEFSSHAGVTDLLAGEKHVFGEEMMVPSAVILDPSATLETPLQLFLSSGLRAFDHAAERWCAAAPLAFSDAVSRHAMELLARALPRVQEEPQDLGARAACQNAAWLSIMGGWSGVPVGASHGIGYILGAARGVPHGLTSCVSLPAVMEWNEPVNAARQREIAAILGGSSAHGSLRRFVSALGLPTTLRELGIAGDTELRELAARFRPIGPLASNPRPITSPEDLFAILQLAA